MSTFTCRSTFCQGSLDFSINFARLCLTLLAFSLLIRCRSLGRIFLIYMGKTLSSRNFYFTLSRSFPRINSQVFSHIGSNCPSHWTEISIYLRHRMRHETNNHHGFSVQITRVLVIFTLLMGSISSWGTLTKGPPKMKMKNQ